MRVSSDIGSHAMLAARLRCLLPGEQFELRGLGRSLWPVIANGARVVVAGEQRENLRLGELVVGWLRDREALVCHVVTALEPARTSPLFGDVDDGELEVLARVVRVEGSGRMRHRMAGSRTVIRTLRRAGRLARELGWTRRARGAVSRMLGSGTGIKVRAAILGHIRTRPLSVEDLEQVALFAGHHLPGLRGTWLSSQIRGPWREGRGGVVGSFDRQGRMRAMGILGRYREEGIDVPGVWFRFLYTSPVVRQLGAMNGVVTALLELANQQGCEEVFSDVRRDNARSLTLHLKHGFLEVPREELAPFEPLISRAERRGHELVILRWRAPEPPAH